MYQLRQHVDEVARRVARVGDRVVVHLGRHLLDVLPALGQQVAVERVASTRSTHFASYAGGVGVELEEVPAVPQRDHHGPHGVADALVGDDQVAAAQDRRGHQEPAHRVGAVAVEDLAHVGVVAQRLRHLVAVGAEHDAVADAVLERRPVEDAGGQDVQRVEPAAGLADVLDDEVAREVVLEPVRVLERVVHLGEAHRAGVEPDVEHVGDAAHRRLARSGRRGSGGSGRRRTAGAGPARRPVDAAGGRSRARAPRTSRRRRSAGTPRRRSSTPAPGEPQNRLRVIDQSRAFSSHLPNEPSLVCSGTQLICWLSSSIRSLNAVTSTNHDETPL